MACSSLKWPEPITGKMQMANTVAKNKYSQITCIVIIINNMQIVILSYEEEHTYLFWHLVLLPFVGEVFPEVAVAMVAAGGLG